MGKKNTRAKKDLLFHALVSIKRLKEGLGRDFHYSFPHPKTAISAKELTRCPGSSYTPVGRIEEHSLSMPDKIDPLIHYCFEQIKSGSIPQRFLLELENGRVFGEGHIINGDNRLVSDVSLYFSQHDNHWLLGPGKLPEPIKVSGTMAILDSPGSGNYFHWTLDTIPRFNLLKDHLKEIDWFYIGNRASFQQAWLKKLEIPQEKILVTTPLSHFQADRLLIPSFSHKSGLYTDAAYHFIRSFMPPMPDATRKIYISRSHARRRRIVNEEVILPLLEKQGYEVHHLDGMTVDAQMELFGSASHIIAPHGAELTNLIYCHPDTKVLEIFSPYYINLCYWTISTQIGLNYSCLIGKGGETVIRNKKNPLQVWRNIRVDETKLEEFLADF